MKKTFLLLLLPLYVVAQNNTAVFDRYLDGQASLYEFNGNVLISKNGKILYRKSFGYADFDTKKKLDSNSVFDCGSIAKEFTAMGILLLKDKNKVSYSDTLGKFFPELPYTGITIQQLLTHTSGMPNGFALIEKFFDHEKIATNADLVSLLAREKPPLLFKPGTDLAYSGTAFNLLASIIEKISGKSYNSYMNEEIFKPLGMTHTQVANGPRSAQKIPGYAYGYMYSDSLKRYTRADSQQSGWTSYWAGITGEGMIITTTGDLLKWDRALRTNTLLTPKTQKEMLSPQSNKAMPKVSFGYGMIVGQNDLGNYTFHNGYFPGYVSMHLHYTDDDVTVIVLSNNQSHSDFIADALAAITLDKKIVLPGVHNEIHGAGFGKYGGNYMMQLMRPPFMAVFPVEFIERNGSLYIHPANGVDARLIPESENKFFFADGSDQQIEFATDNNRNPISVWHIAWGVRKELKKIE